MANLLDAIKSFIGYKKKDEELPKIGMTPNVFSTPVQFNTPVPKVTEVVPPPTNNISNLFDTIKTGVGDLLKETGKDFKEINTSQQNLQRQGVMSPMLGVPTEEAQQKADALRKIVEPIKVGPVPVGKVLTTVGDFLGSKLIKKYSPEEQSAFKKVYSGENLTDQEKKIVQTIANNEMVDVGMVSGGLDTGKKLISSGEELASVIAREYKTKAGQSISESLANILGKVEKKFQISEDLLNKIDTGPLTGNSFSIERVGKNLELILDEGFRPIKFIEDNIAKASKGIRATMDRSVIKTPIEGEIVDQTMKLLPGESKPLTSKQATQIFKKTGKAYEFKNIVPSSGDTLVGFEPGSDLTKLKYNEGNPLPERDFNKMMEDGDRFLKDKYGLKTPVQYSKQQVSRQVFQEKSNQKILDQADEVFNEDLINPQGRGGLTVPQSIVKSIEGLKDNARILLNRETPARNIEGIAGTNAPAFKEFFFDRVSEDTKNVNNFVKKVRQDITDNIINKMDIKPGSVDDQAVMKWGESDHSLKTLDALKNELPDVKNWDNVITADKFFRKTYDDMLTQINKAIGKFGYDPVKKRNDYYTHFQELGNIFDIFGTVFRDSKLPSYLSGLTSNFRPGKQFFRFAQPRLGTDTVNSAIGAIDRYIEPASNQIFRTDTIQRGRLLDKTIRDVLEKNSELPAGHLNNFTAWLTDYINTVSGKKTGMARATEELAGRDIYGAIKAIKRQTSANLVAGNVSSALTNFIPLTQSLASTSKEDFIKGLINATLHPLIEGNNYTIDGVQSAFLRNRYPSDKLAPSLWENVGKKAGWLFESVDRFVSNSIVSGKYFESLANGMGKEQAMNVADDYGRRLMADRSLGQIPQVFQDQGLLSLFTQFQLEINNQVSHLLTDIPAMAGQNKVQIASMLGQIFLYSWLFNNVTQTFTGRRPAFDPIDMALTTAEELQSNKKPDQKAMAIGKKVVDNLPFVQVFTSGGRIPVMAGFPKLNEIADNPVQALLKPLLIFGAPAGGYQIYKGVQGLQDFMRGYEQDSNKKVRYPIDQNPANFIRSILFGSYSFPEAVDYYKNNQSPLGYEDSSAFKQLKANDPKMAQEFYNRILIERDLTSDVSSLSEDQNKLKMMIADPSISQEEKTKMMDEYQKRVEMVVERTQNKLGKEKSYSPVMPSVNGSINGTTINSIKPSSLPNGTIDPKAMDTALKEAIANPTDGTISKLLSNPTGSSASSGTKKAKGKKLSAKAPSFKAKIKFKVAKPSKNKPVTVKKIIAPKLKMPRF